MGRLLSSSIDGSISEWDLFDLKQKVSKNSLRNPIGLILNFCFFDFIFFAVLVAKIVLLNKLGQFGSVEFVIEILIQSIITVAKAKCIRIVYNMSPSY